MEIKIRDEEEFKKKISKLKEDGLRNLHIIADFDQTLTKAYTEDRKTVSSFAQIRDGGYLTDEYKKKAYELFDIYYPIEKDPTIPIKEKIKKMEEWWNKHMELMVEVKLSKDILMEIARKGDFHPRDSLFEMIDFIKDNELPFLIFSAGLGDVIDEYLRTLGKLTKNVHIISNFYNFNEEGSVIGYKSRAIHVFNKNEISIKGTPYHDEIKNRKNVILLGDSMGDLNMADGMEHDCIIKIGFLNHDDPLMIEQYTNAYDVVLMGDASLEYVLDLLKRINN